MVQCPNFFEVYGFTIEVHAGGRRFWPPSFKRFIKEGLDKGKLALTDVMQECNVSQSLVYKWRADVKASRIRTATVTEGAFFSEVVVHEDTASLAPSVRLLLVSYQLAVGPTRDAISLSITKRLKMIK